MKDFVYLKTSEHTGSIEPCRQVGEFIIAKHDKQEKQFHIRHKPDIFQLPATLLTFIKGRKSFRLFCADVKSGETISLPETIKGNSGIIPPHTLNTLMKFEALNQLSNMRQAKLMMMMFIICGIGIGCLVGFLVSQMFLPHEITLKTAEGLKQVTPANAPIIAGLIGGAFK
jgi:hypothetical protein